MKKTLLFFLTLFLASNMLVAQDKTVSGIVKDATGEALPGVSVLIKGTTVGTVTNVEGAFKIAINGDSDVLVFSFIGYKTQEVTVGSKTQFDISLVEDTEVLEEVVVTALGITRDKASLGYAVQQVDSEQLTKSGNTNVIDAMNGKVAGVQITSAGGEAGAGVSMVIRGYTNISGSNQPLYVVDGVPINNSSTTSTGSGAIAYGGTGFSNRAIDINPDDIESISVLKGGAAAALYGIRAGNGAVIITTKKGSGGKKGLNVEYNFAASTDKVNKYLDETPKYARGRGGTYSNVTHWSWGPAYASNPTFPSGTSVYLDGQGLTDVSGQEIPFYADNFKNFWDDGSMTKHSVNVSGATDKGSFYSSFTHLDQGGITPNQDYGRVSMLIRGEQSVTDKLKIRGKANFIKTTSTRFRQANGVMEGLGYFHHMFNINGDWKDENGDKAWFSSGVPHPQWTVNEQGEDSEVNRIIGNAGFNYKIADWLAVDYSIGLDQFSETRKEVRPIGSVNANSQAGDVTELRYNSRDINSKFLLTGQVDVNSDLNVSYTVGNEIFRNENDRLYVRGDELVLRGQEDISNSLTQEVINSTGGRMLIGVFGDVNFGYKDFLYLGASVRNDWSSTLPKENRSFMYPSVNLGFVFSELLDMPWLNLGKFRASYSEVAQDAPTQSLLTTFTKDPNIQGYSAAGQPLYTFSDTQNNPALRPVNTKEIEIGAEFRFLDNLIGLDLAYFKKNSVDQIIRVPLSVTTGFNDFYANIGEVQNKGIEAVLTINNPIKVKDLNWSTSFNFTKIEGEVLEVADGLDEVTLAFGWWTNAELKAVKGAPFGALYGYKYTRHENGQILIGEDGYPVTDSEKTIIGNINPDWTLGINNNMSYKGINFDFTLEIKKGGDIVNGTEANRIYAGLSERSENRYYSADDPYANATRVFEGVDSDGNQNTIAAPLTNNFYQQNYINTDENLIEDASWVRLRSVSLGYSLPKSLLEKTPFQSVNISFTGRNLWLNTDYQGVDPEGSALGPGNFQGFDELRIPGTKSYIMSLKVRF